MLVSPISCREGLDIVVLVCASVGFVVRAIARASRSMGGWETVIVFWVGVSCIRMVIHLI